MSTPALSTPRAVSCPYCQARPGDPCTLLDGTEMTGRHGGHHLTRVFQLKLMRGAANG